MARTLQVSLELLLTGALVLLGGQRPQDAAVAGVVILVVAHQDVGETGQLLADVLQLGGHTVPT